MARLFGTDGVRGLANRDITANLALSIGAAAARILGEQARSQGRRPRVLVGRDPRQSGDFLSAAVTAGLASAGADAEDLGVVPTPAVAYLTGAEDADFAIMISASHNAMADNGIKIFARGGHKLPDDVEDRIEAAMSQQWDRPIGAEVGRISSDSGGSEERYVEHLVSSLAGVSLEGLRIAVDCANGAASRVGPQALRAAGADVVVLNAFPDGANINDQCGSTHPEQLQAATVAAEADFGVAFDGDADRCLAVDENGDLVNGDQIMGILAAAFKADQRLPQDTLVVTTMSNLGLLLAMKAAGIRTVQTDVGDRYVLEAMRAENYGLGGEQSGHLIIADYATTGDGTLTALHLAAQVKKSGQSLAVLASDYTMLPQELINVRGVDKSKTRTHPILLEAVATAEQRLGETGRVLLRPSGTEPLVRVMVEAATAEQALTEAQFLADTVKRELAL